MTPRTHALPLRQPTALHRGRDGPRSRKHLLTHTQRGQEPGVPWHPGDPKALEPG